MGGHHHFRGEGYGVQGRSSVSTTLTVHRLVNHRTPVHCLNPNAESRKGQTIGVSADWDEAIMKGCALVLSRYRIRHLAPAEQQGTGESFLKG